MKTELCNFDIFPKIVPADRSVEITVRPLGAHAAFDEGGPYAVQFLPMTGSLEGQGGGEYECVSVRARRGVLRFTHAFPGEQEHYVRLFRGFPEERTERVANLSVYSLLPDLFARRPYRCDFHVHSCRSDGREAPAVVAANYRKAGFDVMAVTDHGQWEPSKEAMDAWAGKPADIRLYHGEEVHTPGNHIHIVHFGGNNSVNALASGNEEKYREEVESLRGGLGELPAGVDGFEYAACLWTAARIREAGGMSVYCHPHWVADVYHVRDAMTWHVLGTMLLDAFELLGGQTVPENNMQLALYNEARARGLTIPVVASSDSHGTVNADWFNWVSTAVFAESSDLHDIIGAVKLGYSAALEHYPGERPRAHGPYRMASFAMFLLRDYFPLHDELCFEEGRAMKDYICGDDSALEILKVTQGRTKRLLDKCYGTMD